MNLRALGMMVLLGACTTDDVVPTGSDGELVITRMASGAAIGESCDHEHGHQCGPGLTCMTYYGIAGPSGPEFETCEIPCDAKTSCPDGLTCGVWTEGPGAVCR